MLPLFHNLSAHFITSDNLSQVCGVIPAQAQSSFHISLPAGSPKSYSPSSINLPLYSDALSSNVLCLKGLAKVIPLSVTVIHPSIITFSRLFFSQLQKLLQIFLIGKISCPSGSRLAVALQQLLILQKPYHSICKISLFLRNICWIQILLLLHYR